MSITIFSSGVPKQLTIVTEHSFVGPTVFNLKNERGEKWATVLYHDCVKNIVQDELCLTSMCEPVPIVNQFFKKHPHGA